METKSVNVDPAADAAFENFLAEFTASNPALAQASLRIRGSVLREILRTTFYLAWEGGENNAVSKIDQ